MTPRLKLDAPGGWSDAKCSDSVIKIAGELYDPFFDDQEEAIHLCNGTYDGVVCPIREKCLTYALANNEKFGVWGGMSELGRKAMRRKFPHRKGKDTPKQWRHMTEDEALEGVDRCALEKELAKEKAQAAE